ncbi:MAG: hypothetical protein ABIT16_07840 [Croceibacterium sp.]
MPSPGTLALAIIGGGIALGSVLGAAAHPQMQHIATPGFQLSGRPAIELAGQGQVWVEAGPEDLSVADGYRPDLDYDKVVSADWIDSGAQWYGEDPAAEAPAAASSDPDLAAASVSADTAVRVAQQASEAARPEVQVAQVSDGDIGETGRTSKLASSGLY